MGNEGTSPGLFAVDDCVVLVVGGSSGIGRMMADGFVQAGARVYVASRDLDACEVVASELGELGSCAALGVDIADRDSIERLLGELGERESRLDVVVLAAGTTWAAPLAEYPERAFDRNWAVNLKGPFFVVVEALDLLRRGVESRGFASVIILGSSDGTLVPTWENYAYSASKAAVHHLTKHLASALAAENIRVNCLAPGAFRSRMSTFVFDDPVRTDELLDTIPLGREGSNDEAAGAALFLGSRASGYITGAVIPLDGGWAAVRP